MYICIKLINKLQTIQEMSSNKELKIHLKYILSELYCLNKLASVGAFSLLSDAIQIKTGTIFLSRTSGTDISNKVSGLFLGQTIIGITAYAIIQGITVVMCTLCSQAYGAGKHKLVGTYFMRALLIGLLTCFPLWSIWIGVTPLIHYITGDIELAEGAGQYTRIYCIGYPAYIYYKLASGFLQSQNIVYSIMCIMAASNICNICLQYTFVVILQLQITGVGLAYIISTIVAALCMFAYVKMTDIHVSNFNTWSVDFIAGWYQLLKYGVVCLLQLLLDVIVYRIVPIVFIGFILKDKEQLALFGILNIVWFIGVSVSIGYGVGVSVRIGNLLGEGDIQRAKRSTVIGVIYLLFFECCLSALVLSLAGPLSHIFTTIENMRVQIEVGLRIISFCALSDIFSALRNILIVCSLQLHAILIQFVCNLLIASPLAILLSYYVSWRAGGYLLMPAVFSIIAFLLQILLLYLYDWDKIISKVQRNTHLQDIDISVDGLLYSTSMKTLLILRYIALLCIGLGTFVSVILISY